MKHKIIILIGPPCSGKSTWTKNFIKQNKNYVRINRDDLRNMLNGTHLMKFEIEELVNKIFDDIILRSINQNKNIIIDNTNCRIKHIKDIINNNKNSDFIIKIFEVPIWKLKIRNVFRYIKTGVYIPIEIIKIMHNRCKYININLASELSNEISNIKRVIR